MKILYVMMPLFVIDHVFASEKNHGIFVSLAKVDLIVNIPMAEKFREVVERGDMWTMG